MTANPSSGTGAGFRLVAHHSRFGSAPEAPSAPPRSPRAGARRADPPDRGTAPRSNCLDPDLHDTVPETAVAEVLCVWQHPGRVRRLAHQSREAAGPAARSGGQVVGEEVYGETETPDDLVFQEAIEPLRAGAMPLSSAFHRQPGTGRPGTLAVQPDETWGRSSARYPTPRKRRQRNRSAESRAHDPRDREARAWHAGYECAAHGRLSNKVRRGSWRSLCGHH
jgi:hypothetical protein